MHVGGSEIGGAGKAAIEMRGYRIEPPEREIGEAGVKLRFRVSGEEAAAHSRLLRRVARHLDEAAEQRQPRMRQRVALAGRGEQHRGAAVRFQIGGMGRKPRNEDQRRAVDVGRDIDQRSERMAGIAVDASPASRPASSATASLATDFGSKSGTGAFSGSRSGITPGKGRSAFLPSARSALAITLPCQYGSLAVGLPLERPPVLTQSHSNCPDFALSGHTSAPTWGLKGIWGRAGDAAADSC